MRASKEEMHANFLRLCLSKNILIVPFTFQCFIYLLFIYLFHVWKLVGFSLCVFIRKSLVAVPCWASTSIVQSTSSLLQSWRLRSLGTIF